MRDPSLVASKADIGQQAIKGGEAPKHKVAALQPAARGQEPRGRSQLRGSQ